MTTTPRARRFVARRNASGQLWLVKDEVGHGLMTTSGDPTDVVRGLTRKEAEELADAMEREQLFAEGQDSAYYKQWERS